MSTSTCTELHIENSRQYSNSEYTYPISLQTRTHREDKSYLLTYVDSLILGTCRSYLLTDTDLLAGHISLVTH